MDTPAHSPQPAREIGEDFEPRRGDFLRTLEFPQNGAEGEIKGRIWMEAGRDPKKGTWVLWRKSVHEMDDPLTGKPTNVLSAEPLFSKTSFLNAYDQMTTFESSMRALGASPLPGKTPAKLAGDYFPQFAWREGLMMSRSGRLYPVSEDLVNAANFFNEQDLLDAKAFLDREKNASFVPVPVTLPSTDWAREYAAEKARTDQRLGVLYHRHGGDPDSFALALDLVQEDPAVLYAHIQKGFSPKVFEKDPEQHFALAKAAIERASVEPLSLLVAAGLHFYVRFEDETPLECALKARRYSHLHLMLEQGGVKLANFADATGTPVAVEAMKAQDPQAFRMLYLEGLDFSHTDPKGWALVHHAFDNNFMPGVYAWLDEGLPIDFPVQGTAFTGVSIAKAKKNQALIDFAVKMGADKDAPAFGGDAPAAPGKPAPAGVSAFSADLLNSSATNAEIEKAASAHVAAGGGLDLLAKNGASLFELCWKNRKASADLDRRALMPVLGKLGADASALLPDGTTVLTRIASAPAFDAEFLKNVAPFAKDANKGDANGNTILHALQLNPSEAAGHSNNVAAVLKLFPGLDLELPNKDGYGNIALAVRLNRAQTLKAFSGAKPDWARADAGGWSVLDLAFTAACGQRKVSGAPRADKILAASDSTREAVLGMLERDTRRDTLSAAFARARPDGKTLGEVLAAENAPARTVSRLIACGMQKT
jgi:hypothetical protein